MSKHTGSGPSTSQDFAQHMAAVAKALLGDPHPIHSKNGEWRYGTNGSLKIDVVGGRWYDFEAEEGGNIIELIQHVNGGDAQAATQWMRDKGILPNGSVGRARSVVATYSYQDATGREVFQVLRYQPKDFRQRRWDGSQWVWSVKGLPVIPYKLPQLLEALAYDRVVFVVEGEGKADLLWSWNVPATCNAGGSKKWRGEHAEFFPGADVVIMGDHDQAGRDHVDVVGKSLVGIAQRIRVLHLPNLKHKGDVVNWAESGGTADKLWQLVETDAKPWAPRPVQPALPFEPIPFTWRDPEHIKRRPWLYAKHYIRGYVSVTIGRRGNGKTTRAIAEILSMVTGRDLLNVGSPNVPEKPLQVWYIGEDTRDEIERRIVAACVHYGITEQDISGRLFFNSVFEMPLEARKVATLQKGAAVTRNQAVIDALKTGIAEQQADVLVLDPLKKFHGVKENDNDQMDEVMVIFSEIAMITSVSIEILHHTRKPSAGNANAPMTIDDGRGADAIVAAARSARIINGMLVKEASSLGISPSDGWQYARIDNGKANMVPPGKAIWARMASESLPCGESVGVLEPWKLPDAFEGITTADLELAQQLAQTGAYRADSRAADWFGYALAKQLNIPIAFGGNNSPADVAKIKIILKTWIKNGGLRVEEGTDEGQRKPRKFILPGKQDEPQFDDEE
jgi:hypothetical protein